MDNYIIILFWVAVSVFVAVLEHDHSPQRDNFRMLFGYILINLIVWYATVLEWMLIKYLTRRKK